MDLETMVSLVGSLGFPIVACVYLAHFNNQTLKELKDTLNSNTVVLEKLLTKLDVKKED